MTGKEVVVTVDSEQVSLPSEPPPRVLEDHTDSSSDTFLTSAGPVTLSVVKLQQVAVMGLPDFVEDTFLLVEPELAQALPHRTDLLVPAFYTMASRDSRSRSENWRKLFVLEGVGTAATPNPDIRPLGLG